MSKRQGRNFCPDNCGCCSGGIGIWAEVAGRYECLYGVGVPGRTDSGYQPRACGRTGRIPDRQRDAGCMGRRGLSRNRLYMHRLSAAEYRSCLGFLTDGLYAPDITACRDCGILLSHTGRTAYCKRVYRSGDDTGMHFGAKCICQAALKIYNKKTVYMYGYLGKCLNE